MSYFCSKVLYFYHILKFFHLLYLKVEINNIEKVIGPNESVFIPLGAKHILSNPTKLPLILIEIQSGSYLGEDDIKRFEDKYGRGNN